MVVTRFDQEAIGSSGADCARLQILAPAGTRPGVRAINLS